MTEPDRSLQVGEIMRRILAEAARRRPLGHASMMEVFPAKRKYALEEFLQFENEAFVQAVHQGLLRREAEPDRCDAYVEALRSGRMSKIDLLIAVRWSKDGRRYAVKVTGLDRRRRLRWLEKVLLLGRRARWRRT
ncbi:MAG: DUF4214 domain-containing protein [Inquilinus sp.]|uniref:DUF4214 domain-containing protein n=1 Tax=Inquilinus sp. TaxID=1932117 RepID=UPI003F346952